MLALQDEWAEIRAFRLPPVAQGIFQKASETGFLKNGGNRIRTYEARSATGLQPVPFSHSGIPPESGKLSNTSGKPEQVERQSSCERPI